MDCKLVSVIIPVYKIPEDYLKESLSSIINQTYKNLEILLVVDGDSSITQKVVEELHDERIKILINTEGTGLVYSLNRGLREANGDYVIRMDGDDICRTNRFRKQIEYLELHTYIDVLGSFAKTFGAFEKIYSSGTSAKEIEAELILKNPIVHPTVVFRKTSIQKYEISYDNGESEDYRLWIDLVFKNKCKLEVIPEVLLDYRIHEGQATVVKSDEIDALDKKIANYILDLLDISFTENELEIFYKIRNTKHFTIKESIEALLFSQKLINEVTSYISKRRLKQIIRKRVLRNLLRKDEDRK
ncbi:MAG: glycosyltransferase [Lachnospiraceae bacterium]|nr:glycosyltransferase [Lachnospiraceae bacterium]